MSQGPIEEAGKVASNAIEALRGTPALLAVILLQMATLGALFFISSANSERQQAREMRMIELCWPPP